MTSLTSNIPRLSVGVPTFNQANYLGQTLDSLLLQEQTPFEIVVSDNHSTDETQSILNDYKDRIRIISPPRHLGMMEHWNFLVSNLGGDWVSLLSSDDLAKPNYVRTLLEGISHSKNAVLVRAGWENIDAQGNILDKRYLLSVSKCTRPPKTFLENLRGPKSSFAAFSVKKTAWENVGGFPTGCKYFGDWAFWLRLSPLGDFIYEHRIISGYRTNYRPGLVLNRLLFELSDEEVISTHILPEVSAKIGEVGQSVINKARRDRLLARLSQLSSLIAKDQRNSVAELMTKWAQVAGCEAELSEFKTGKNFVSKPNPIRTYIRRMVHVLRS